MNTITLYDSQMQRIGTPFQTGVEVVAIDEIIKLIQQSRYTNIVPYIAVFQTEKHIEIYRVMDDTLVFKIERVTL